MGRNGRAARRAYGRRRVSCAQGRGPYVRRFGQGARRRVGFRQARAYRFVGEGAACRCARLGRAALEVHRAGAVSESYLMCEALNKATVLSGAALGGGTVDFRPRRVLLSAVAREVRRLHDAGLYTRDLQETNLMVEEHGTAPPRISFVDLEDFRRVRAVSWHRRLLNLVHLDRSIG